MWMFAGENREAPTWLQRAALEGRKDPEAMGWEPRIVLTAKQVQLAVELGREGLGYQSTLGPRFLGTRVRTRALSPWIRVPALSLEPGLGGWALALVAEWNLCGASE